MFSCFLPGDSGRLAIADQNRMQVTLENVRGAVRLVLLRLEYPTAGACADVRTQHRRDAAVEFDRPLASGSLEPIFLRTVVILFNDPQTVAIVQDILKATGTAVGSHEVGWFLRKLQVRGARHGVLVALSGIAGKADGVTSAYSEILDAQTKDDIKILLLTREDISTLTDTRALSENLQRQFLALTLRRVVNLAKE